MANNNNATLPYAVHMRPTEISLDPKDKHSRYKTPQLQIVHQKHGTSLINLKYVAKAMLVPAEWLLAWIGYDLSCKILDTDSQPPRLKGIQSEERLSRAICGFITDILLCNSKSCGLPEVSLEFEQRKLVLIGTCRACHDNSPRKVRHQKFLTFVKSHPPVQNQDAYMLGSNNDAKLGLAFPLFEPTVDSLLQKNKLPINLQNHEKHHQQEKEKGDLKKRNDEKGDSKKRNDEKGDSKKRNDEKGDSKKRNDEKGDLKKRNDEKGDTEKEEQTGSISPCEQMSGSQANSDLIEQISGLAQDQDVAALKRLAKFHSLTYQDLLGPIFCALHGGTPFQSVQILSSRATLFLPFLQFCTADDETAQTQFCALLAPYCYQSQTPDNSDTLTGATAPPSAELCQVFHWFYDKEIVSEDAILRWAGLSVALPFRSPLAPFLKWLAEAESEDEE